MARQGALTGSESGFTLLEVIIAFAILALVLGAVFETFSLGLRNVGEAGDHARATIHAESKLARLGNVEPIEPGETGGRFDDRYRWRLSVRRAALHESALEGENVHPLLEIALTVFWGNGSSARQMTFTTFRLGNAASP